jgi:3-hydroxyisobutyrate dehydrogenase-like beta-hydroxyacid dehydrogenase
MSGQAVGLCGCGNMGSAIAARLAPQVELTVFDLDAARTEEVARELGVRSASSLSDLASAAGVVVLSLPTAAASQSVIRELASLLVRGSVVVETSTLNPSDIRAVAPVCNEAGVLLVDAPILSGVAQMRDGVSTLLVGGDVDALRAAEPLLEALAPRRIRLGALGTGMAAKVANNAVAHAVMVVLLEATAMAEASGVAPDVFAELLTGPDAGLTRPLTHRLVERVFGADYEGGMPMEAARKDSVLALRLAHETGVPLFAIQGAHTPYELAIAAGYERDDYAALAKLWEEWTGRPLRPGGDL